MTEADLVAFYPVLRKIANRYSRSGVDKEDLVQEAAMKIWRTRGSYDPARGELHKWMARAASAAMLWKARHVWKRLQAEKEAIRCAEDRASSNAYESVLLKELAASTSCYGKKQGEKLLRYALGDESIPQTTASRIRMEMREDFSA